MIEFSFSSAGTVLLAQADNPPVTPASRSLLDLVVAGGPVGYLIILLSLVGVALVIDAFVRLRGEHLMPEALTDETLVLAGKRQFEEVHALAKTSDSLVARVVTAGLKDGRLGLDAVREGFQQQGEGEFTRLRQRNGYLGLIAAVAPMLGLLGTVTGMISSFRLLGESQGSARPDELALGISQALVTTCMGLVLAVPLTFFYAFFRDRINRMAHEVGGYGDRLLRTMTVAMAGKPTAAPTSAAPAPKAAGEPAR